jgi:hypothetical protein
MNTFQIECLTNKALRGSRRRNFLGVFPSDRLPSLASARFPCSYISNTDPSSSEGSHWVAFYHTASNRCEFFDSFGFPPSVYGFHVRCQLHNARAVQMDTSTTCGHHCVNFIVHRILNNNLNPQRFANSLFSRYRTKLSIDRHVKARIDALSRKPACSAPPCPASLADSDSQCCKARCSAK